MKYYLKINEKDNVAVAIKPLKKGTKVQFGEKKILLLDNIPQGHKFSLSWVDPGFPLIKYGSVIGLAKEALLPGFHVHSKQLKTNLDGIERYIYRPEEIQTPQNKGFPDSFSGYKRSNGKVGLRNEIWIITTVGCVNKTAEKIAVLAEEQRKDRYEGVFAFTHPFGCSQLGEDQKTTQKILSGLVHHPHAGGVLVLGLGCENNNIEEFKKVLGDYDSERVQFLVCQDVEDELAVGLEIIESLAELLKNDQREDCPINSLVLGLKCGGSDGLSGITANPLIGRASDSLVACGGTAMLTEVPEMFGAERFLMNRAASRAVFEKIVRLINDFKNYYRRYNQVIYENPSPGNKDGGITTLEEKSLGCIQKGGQSPVVDVLEYGQSPVLKGLNLVNGPGNDGVAVTNLVASGAQMILFSTGRGTPLGGPVPTLKIATNTALWKKKKHWIDFNAGVLVENTDPDKVLQDFINTIIQVASGKKACNEEDGYREISLFKDGVTL